MRLFRVLNRRTNQSFSFDGEVAVIMLFVMVLLSAVLYRSGAYGLAVVMGLVTASFLVLVSVHFIWPLAKSTVEWQDMAHWYPLMTPLQTEQVISAVIEEQGIPTKRLFKRVRDTRAEYAIDGFELLDCGVRVEIEPDSAEIANRPRRSHVWLSSTTRDNPLARGLVARFSTIFQPVT